MPSSEKTSLGLNQWQLQDRPSINDFNGDNRITNDEIEATQNKLASHISTTDSEFSQVNGRITDTNDRITETESDINQKIDGIQNKIDVDISGEIDSLNQRHNDLSSDVESNFNSLSNSISTVNTNLSQRIDSTDLNVSSLGNQVDSLATLTGSKADLYRTITPYQFLWNDVSLPLEMGLWTPILYGVREYTVQQGIYYRIGDLITISYRIVWAQFDPGFDPDYQGSARISGLPFANGSYEQNNSPALYRGITMHEQYPRLSTYVLPRRNNIGFYQSGDSPSHSAALLPRQFNNNGGISGSFQYIILQES